jgi:hypothetical protein
MTKRELVHSVLLSFGYVLLFLGIAHKIDFITGKYSLIVLVVGLAILYFREELSNKIPVKIASMVVVQSIGLILIFLGFQAYAQQYLDSLWLWYILGGAIIFNYSAKISKALTKDEGGGGQKPATELEIK